jgi:hypothetical protein
MGLHLRVCARRSNGDEQSGSKAYADTDRHELHIAVVGRDALIARFHEERRTARHGDFAAEPGVP